MPPRPRVVPNINPPPSDQLLERYRELMRYVSLTDEDVLLCTRAWNDVEPLIPELVDDFYEEILRHPDARDVFDNVEQVARLKRTLGFWITELFAGTYDEAFVTRRWQVGFRHVQIGLAQVWVSAAMTRLRERMLDSLYEKWSGPREEYHKVASVVRRMMDLDLALIQDAYHAESVAQRIARERDFAEGVIETAQAVVLVVDLKGHVVRGNTFLREILSGTPQNHPPESSDSESIPSLNILSFVAEAQRDAFRRFLAETADGSHAKPLETDLRSIAKPRRIRWHARSLSPRGPAPTSTIPLDSNTNSQDPTSSPPPLVLCVGQDITDLTETQRLLVRQERLAAIGQTMTGLAHESRNAFQRSQASLETLLLELEDRPSAVELIERIQRAHDHLLHLYEEVLQFARPVRLELQRLRLTSHLEQTWNYVQQAALAHSNHPVATELRILHATENDEVMADPFAVEQVLRNLLENAAQASDGPAKIDAVITEDWIGTEPAVRIEIRDYGRGLPKEYTERVFEPFFTTRSRGTGLGLPIARRLIESHGGSLGLKSAQDGGTIAEIVLPRVAVPDEQLPTPVEDTRRQPQP